METRVEFGSEIAAGTPRGAAGISCGKVVAIVIGVALLLDAGKAITGGNPVPEQSAGPSEAAVQEMVPDFPESASIIAGSSASMQFLPTEQLAVGGAPPGVIAEVVNDEDGTSRLVVAVDSSVPEGDYELVIVRIADQREMLWSFRVLTL